MEQPWFVYCLSTVQEPIRTYIGATINLDRRLSQHNGEQRGGAKATSRVPGGWYRVCHIEGFESEKQALSFEWHWKHFSRGGCVTRKVSGDPLTRRQKGLDKSLEWAKEKGYPNLKVNQN